MKLENIKEQKNRYRIVCAKTDEDYILGCLKELKGRFIYKYDIATNLSEIPLFTNIIYDTECDELEIKKFINKHMNYLATFETYEKRFD